MACALPSSSRCLGAVLHSPRNIIHVSSVSPCHPAASATSFFPSTSGSIPQLNKLQSDGGGWSIRKRGWGLAVQAASSGAFSEGSNDNDRLETSKEIESELLSSPASPTSRDGLIPKGNTHNVRTFCAFLATSLLVAAGVTYGMGGPEALQLAVTRSGFAAAFSLIFISEIGDKTFFIAALLAMRHSRILVLLGASLALALMTVISVVLGRLFRKVPAQLHTTLPIGEYLACALLLWFGFRSIRAALALPVKAKEEEVEEGGELASAEEVVNKFEAGKLTTPMSVFVEAFSLVFVAEWGDRSMLATIALGAAQSPMGVAGGAIAGHVAATMIAVLGGSLLAKYISERVVGLIGGVFFLIFAVATLMGVF